jgi:hypothetical protein
MFRVMEKPLMTIPSFAPVAPQGTSWPFRMGKRSPTTGVWRWTAMGSDDHGAEQTATSAAEREEVRLRVRREQRRRFEAMSFGGEPTATLPLVGRGNFRW